MKLEDSIPIQIDIVPGEMYCVFFVCCQRCHTVYKIPNNSIIRAVEYGWTCTHNGEYIGWICPECAKGIPHE